MARVFGQAEPGDLIIHAARDGELRRRKQACDLVSRAWLGLPVTSTSFCSWKGVVMPGSGGRASPGQLLAGGRRVTQGCGKNVGHPLSSRRLASGGIFFFSSPGFKIKLHLTLKEQNIVIQKPDKCHNRGYYSLLVLLL